MVETCDVVIKSGSPLLKIDACRAKACLASYNQGLKGIVRNGYENPVDTRRLLTKFNAHIIERSRVPLSIFNRMVNQFTVSKEKKEKIDWFLMGACTCS